MTTPHTMPPFITPGYNEGLSILRQIQKLRTEIGNITKGQENAYHKYNFRGIDDVLDFVGPAMVGTDIIPVLEFGDHIYDVMNLTKKNQNVVSAPISRVRLDMYFVSSEDGSAIRYRVFGEARDETDDKSTSKAQTSAVKYAVFVGLMIPVQPGMIEDSDNNQDTDEAVAASRASSAINKKDEGKNRTSGFNRAREYMTTCYKAKDSAKLKQCITTVNKTESFTAEERAALLRLIEEYLTNLANDGK